MKNGEKRMTQKKDLLLVIDMQNVYLPGQEWSCPSMGESIRNICRILDRDAADYTAFTQFVPPQEPVGTWKQYNTENKEINENLWLNEIVTELVPYVNQEGSREDAEGKAPKEETRDHPRYPLYNKSIYSSMKIPELTKLARQADRIVLSGVVAECCVLATMMEAIDLGCQVIYLTDCISGQSLQNENAIRKIAESFSPLHTLVMTSEEYLQQKRTDNMES